MPHIFISYSRRNSKIMQRVRDMLHNQGFDVWTDEINIKHGDQWAKEIERAIEQAFCIVVLLSPPAKASEWVDKELAYATSHEIPIYPILVEGDAKTALPVRLVNIQYEDGRSNIDIAVVSLTKTLSKYKPEKRSPVQYIAALVEQKVSLEDNCDQQRVENITKHLVEHFKANLLPKKLKALLIASSRQACSAYKDELDKYFGRNESEVSITSKGNDSPELARFHHTKAKEQEILSAFREPGTNPKIIIVVDKYLTGFDVPILGGLYIDRPMKGLQLYQAVARVIRPYPTKSQAYIVDYVGLVSHLDIALKMFSNSD